jgi:hypothetical protein
MCPAAGNETRRIKHYPVNKCPIAPASFSNTPSSFSESVSSGYPIKLTFSATTTK